MFTSLIHLFPAYAGLVIFISGVALSRAALIHPKSSPAEYQAVIIDRT